MKLGLAIAASAVASDETISQAVKASGVKPRDDLIVPKGPASRRPLLF